ncbi:MAG TPA: hypothetical protein VKU40_16620 [Thermoanaerobaculia bacterium]|nr:hypothetical protein [Thermoanaerobaculia bacterium]
MRPVGFSSGSLAGDDAARAVAISLDLGLPAIELSALRLPSLEPLVAALGNLEADLAHFDWVSFHAPSRFSAKDEPWVIALLEEVHGRGWPIVVHPDVLHHRTAWRRFGPGLLVENMDRRKAHGQTADDLTAVFADLPEARFCFDVGHARQVDPTMAEAERLAFTFADRLAEIHLSHVDESSRHHRLTPDLAEALGEIAPLLAPVPVILECPVRRAGAEVLREEVAAAAGAFRL